jgi:protein-L-isoaspartate O-methyltransferase
MHLGFRVWPIGQATGIQPALVSMQAAVVWSFEREKELVVEEGFGCTCMREALDSYK